MLCKPRNQADKKSIFQSNGWNDLDFLVENEAVTLKRRGQQILEMLVKHKFEKIVSKYIYLEIKIAKHNRFRCRHTSYNWNLSLGVSLWCPRILKLLNCSSCNFLTIVLDFLLNYRNFLFFFLYCRFSLKENL